MVTIITELSKYAMILSLAIYTVLGFRLVRRDEAGKKAALWQQNVLMFGMQFLGNLTLYLSTENEKILLDGFSDAELCLLRRFLEQITENIDKIPGPSGKNDTKKARQQK